MSDRQAPPGTGNRRVNPVPERGGPELSVPQVELVASGGQKPRNPRLKWWGWGGAALTVALLALSWFALPIRTISVTGNSRLTQPQVIKLAGLTQKFGWLYYGHWRAKGLLDSPWVQSAVVTRKFPDTVTVEVTERLPVARWQQQDGKIVALAVDGTVMPGADGLEKLPLIQGWGPERLHDALKLMGALTGYNVQSVAYTPSGLSVNVGGRAVWSGDLNSFLKYAGSISMYPNKNINIYPWGVSVQE